MSKPLNIYTISSVLHEHSRYRQIEADYFEVDHRSRIVTFFTMRSWWEGPKKTIVAMDDCMMIQEEENPEDVR